MLVQVITVSRLWIEPFTGLSMQVFRRLVGQVRRRGGAQIADGRPGRQPGTCGVPEFRFGLVTWGFAVSGGRGGGRPLAHGLVLDVPA
jgi:hypothetical protein